MIETVLRYNSWLHQFICVYATWNTYQKLTSGGVDVEGLVYIQPSWVEYEGRWQWLASPRIGYTNEAMMVGPSGVWTRWQSYRNSAARSVE